MIVRSRYTMITKLWRKEIVEWILSHINVDPSCVSSDVVTVLNRDSNIKEVFPKNNLRFLLDIYTMI